MSEILVRAAGLVVIKNKRDELHAAIRLVVKGTEIESEEVRALYGNSGTIRAKLTTTQGSSTHNVSGLSIRLTEAQWQLSKDLKTELNAVVTAGKVAGLATSDYDFAKLKSSTDPASPDFWTWAASLVPPLFPVVITP